MQNLEKALKGLERGQSPEAGAHKLAHGFNDNSFPIARRVIAVMAGGRCRSKMPLTIACKCIRHL